MLKYIKGFLYSDVIEKHVNLKSFLQVIHKSCEEVSAKAIELLKETFTNLGPKLQVNYLLVVEK